MPFGYRGSKRKRKKEQAAPGELQGDTKFVSLLIVLGHES